MRQLMMHSAGHTEIATATTAIGAGGAGATDISVPLSASVISISSSVVT